MASTTNAKLPSSAVKAAAKDVAKDDDADAAAPSGAGSFKTLVIVLVVLDLLAGGAWAWLKFSRNGALNDSIKKNRANLVRLKTDLVNLDETVRRIQRDQVQQVLDPGTLLSAVAANNGLADSLRTDKPLKSKFGRNYEEHTVKFTFTGRASYDFAGMLRFLTAVEKANPTVQIREIDLGGRQTGAGNNMWEVKTGTVRVLKPIKVG